MTEKERLLRTLFETEGQEHLNIKFCRGQQMIFFRGPLSRGKLGHFPNRNAS